MSVIQTRNLSKQLPIASGGILHILKQIDLEIDQGETVAITQVSNERFKRGDNVKLILIKNGEARVIR